MIQSIHFISKDCVVLPHFYVLATDANVHQTILGVADFFVVAQRTNDHRSVLSYVRVHSLKQLFAGCQFFFVFVQTVFLFSDMFVVDLVVEELLHESLFLFSDLLKLLHVDLMGYLTTSSQTNIVGLGSLVIQSCVISFFLREIRHDLRKTR